MQIVVAPDKFKGSLTAMRAAEILSGAFRNVLPEAHVAAVPLSDGGEGFVAALVRGGAGTEALRAVTGPLGEPVDARWGILAGGSAAVLESSEACGLRHVPIGRRDPLRTTTRGLGELIVAARRAGAERVLVGLGGSATNDAGAGMAQALGFRLLDASGAELGPGGAELSRLVRIEPPADIDDLRRIEFVAACDVTNVLTGRDGAAAVFGPQKGADARAIAELDAALEHFAGVAARDLAADVRDVPGGGAAGGLGAGLVAFLHARLVPGFDVVADACRLESRVASADLVVTGEGRLDRQTLMGKAVAGVAALARRHGRPVFAFVGSVEDGPRDGYHDAGITAIFAITPRPMSLEHAIDRAETLLGDAAEQALRAYAAGRAMSPR